MGKIGELFKLLDTVLKYFYIYIFGLLCLVTALIAAIFIKHKNKKDKSENEKYVPKGISIIVIIVSLSIIFAPLLYFIIMG